MKKKIIFSGLATALLIISGALIYQTQASETNVPTKTTLTPLLAESVERNVPTTIDAQIEEKVAPDPNSQQFGVDLSDVPPSAILIPEVLKVIDKNSKNISTNESNEASDLKQTNMLVSDYGNGYHFRATYEAESGNEFTILQVPIEISLETTFQGIKDFYKEPVIETEINGQPAAYVDGRVRKVVHFFNDDRGYTVTSLNSNIIDVLNVAQNLADHLLLK